MSTLAFSPAALDALRRSLATAFFYKNDLRRFVTAAGVPEPIISAQGWLDASEYKVRIVDKIVDGLIELGEKGLEPLRRLTAGLLELPNFDHLKRLEDGSRKVQEAREAAESLRGLVREQPTPPQRPSSKATSPDTDRAAALARMRQKLNEIAACKDAQRRGYLFERFLTELFEWHDLKPRGSFKIEGEQIDGSFEHSGTPFLLEARWTSGAQAVQSLDAFSRKVERRLQNTLGLFVSINGYTVEGLEAFSKGQLRVLLMDGEDLAIVMDGLVDFVEVLRRKQRHAAETGNPFYRVRDMLAG